MAMGILKDHIIIILILLGFLIRLLFAPLPEYKIDMDAWVAWAYRLNQFNFANFYSDRIWTNYTPGYLYVLSILGYIKNLFGINDQLFYEVLKLPSIIAEIFLGILVYKILRKPQKWALVASSFILLNPAFIFNSSVWGQIDGLFCLMLVLSVYFLTQNKIIYSSILLGLSFLIKPQAIILSPVFALFIIKNFSVKNILQLTIPAIVTIFLLSLPFFTTKPILGIPQLFLKMISDYSYTSLNAYNLWGVVGFWIPDNTIWHGFMYQTWGYILFSFYWLFISYFYLKGKLSIYSLATLATLSFFFLPTRVHERYLYPALVFLIISAFQFRSKILIALVVILSLLHLVNLYYVYIFYNKFQLNYSDALYSKSIYPFLASQPYLLSGLSSILFILISIIIIKLNYEKSPG